jgi:hypothetical protein
MVESGGEGSGQGGRVVGRKLREKRGWDWEGRGGEGGGRGTLQGVLDDLELHEEFGRLALDGGQAEMAVEHVLGVFEDGIERIGGGGGDGELDLAADFEPKEMDVGETDGAFELAGGFEDEATIGGRDDAEDGVADFFGEFLPVVVGRNPMGDIGAGGDRDFFGRRVFVGRSISCPFLGLAGGACGLAFGWCRHVDYDAA